jgi:hypothetical protein
MLPEPANNGHQVPTVHPHWHMLAGKQSGEHGNVLQLLPDYRAVLWLV